MQRFRRPMVCFASEHENNHHRRNPLRGGSKQHLQCCQSHRNDSTAIWRKQQGQVVAHSHTGGFQRRRLCGRYYASAVKARSRPEKRRQQSRDDASSLRGAKRIEFRAEIDEDSPRKRRRCKHLFNNPRKVYTRPLGGIQSRGLRGRDFEVATRLGR